MKPDFARQAKLLALTELSGIGDKRALALVDAAGNLESVFEAPFETFADLHYVDEETHRQLRALDDTVEEYEARIRAAADQGVLLLTPIDDEYPNRLRDHHSPLKLFYRGADRLLQTESISFAGSREASSQTINWVTEVSTALANEGHCIVSGGAFGVDAAAHEAALDATGETIIASPSGHENPYPEANSDLFARVERDGLVVSHRFPEQTPARGGFIYRNRTNAALSSAIVIAAADIDSGSMAQYEIAADQDKQIFVPAESVGAEPSGGIAKLREREGVAVVESATDIIDELSSESGQQRLSDW